MALVNTLPNLDLAVIDSFNDMNSLSIADLSQYATIPTTNLVALELTPPGYPTINIPFNPGTVNVYHCSDIGMICGVQDCCALPDGIYDLKYSVIVVPVLVGSLPFIIEKTFIRVDNLRCKWMNAFLKVDLECGCSNPEQRGYKEELKNIDLLINGCIASANNCDDALANKLYQKANNMLNTLCCKFNMPCSEITCNTCGCH